MRLSLALIALALAAGCSKREAEPPADPPPLLPPAELQRAADACRGYVAKVCACAETVAAVREECTLAKAMPEAIEIAKRLAVNPKADRQDAEQAAHNVRQTVKLCIEKTGSLAARGCP